MTNTNLSAITQPILSPLTESILRSLGAVDTLVFHALTFDETTYEMLGVKTGTGDLTETRTSTIYLPDKDDVYREFGSTEPGYWGGRVLRNLITYSRDLTNAAWTNPSARTTVTYDQVGLAGVANTASLLDDSNANYAELTESITISDDSNTNVWRFFVKKDADTSRFPEFDVRCQGGTQQYNQVQLNTSTGATTVRGSVGTVSEEVRDAGLWWELLISVANNGTGNTTGFTRIYPAVTTTWGAAEPAATGSIIVGNVEIFENKAIADIDSGTASAIFTSGAAKNKVYANATPDGAAFSSQITNSITYSRDLTNAAWTPVNPIAVAYDAVGLTSAANTASTLTDDDGAVTEYLQETLTIADNSNTHTLRLFIKKDSDTSRFPGVALQYIGGTAQVIEYHLNTQTGAVTQVSATAGSADSRDAGLWWEMLLDLPNNGTGNTTLNIYLKPAGGTVAGTDSAAATGSCIIGNVELHQNASISDIKSASPVFTSGTAVTQDFREAPYLYCAPAMTNSITYSRDLTNAAWTETGTSVAAYDAVGLTGAANTASTLTDNDGAANENIGFLGTTITNDSNPVTARLFIKKDSDQTRFPEVQFSFAGGTTQYIYAHLNTQTGATNTRASVGTVQQDVRDAGLWWEWSLQVTNNSTGNIQANIYIYPAITDVIGTVNSASTGSIIVGNVELHENKTIAQIRGGSPIFTAGASGTVNAVDVDLTDFATDWSATQSAFYAELYFFGTNSAGNFAEFFDLWSSGATYNASGTFNRIDYQYNNGSKQTVIGPAIDPTPLAYTFSVYGDGVSGLSRARHNGVWRSSQKTDFVSFYQDLSDLSIRSSYGVFLARNMQVYNEDSTAAIATIEALDP